MRNLKSSPHFWLLGGLLILTLSLCMALLERQPTGWDALGYQVAGRNIVQGIGPAIEHPLNAKLGPYFTLAAFADQSLENPARLYLNYPPGFPLLLALPQWLGLPDFLIVPIISALSVLFVYLLGSVLLDRWTGLLGAAIIALTPTFLEWGTSLWADLPGTCFMTGTLATYLAAQRKNSKIHRIALGGIAGAMAVLSIVIKYSNALVLVPLLVYVIYDQRKSVFHSVTNWSFATLVIAGMIGVGLYNQIVYGSPIETHYSASRSGYHFPLFSISYALGPSYADGYSLLGAGKTLWINFSWLLIPATLGLARAPRKAVVLLLGVFLVFFALTSTFNWAPVNEDTRYLLPLFAPVGLLAAKGCLAILDLHTPWRKWGLGVLLIAVGVTLSMSLAKSWSVLRARNQSNPATQQAAYSLTSGSEQDAIFLAYYWNDPINYFGERTTLFYRRMNTRDSTEFENTLVQVVNNLLEEEKLPVYYVVDRQPPLMNSLQILERHFTLQLWKETPISVYRVLKKQAKQAGRWSQGSTTALGLQSHISQKHYDEHR